jgi:hypothetical protein
MIPGNVTAAEIEPAGSNAPMPVMTGVQGGDGIFRTIPGCVMQGKHASRSRTEGSAV